MRLRVLAAGILMQVGLGSAYAWSVFQTPLVEAFGWSISEVGLTFSLLILSGGLGAFLGGLWLARTGPRRVGVAAGLCYGLGIVLAGVSAGRLELLYLFHGLIAGAGLGLGYIVPVATLVRWFPERRGLVTGLAVSAFAVGGLLTAPLAARLLEALGPPRTFVLLGSVYGVVVALAALALRNPATTRGPAVAPTGGHERDIGLPAALRTWQWYGLWVLFFLNVVAGGSFIAAAAPLAVELTGVTPFHAAGIVGAAFVADAAGRLAWPWSSDRVGRRAVFVAIFVLQAVAFVSLTLTTSSVAFGLLAAVVLFSYGGASGTMPALTADYFGPRSIGATYGALLTAWGVGGFVGPLLVARLRDATGAYGSGLSVLGVTMLVSALLPFLLRPPRTQRGLSA